MLFVVKKKNLFILYSENCTKSSRQFNNFYQPITNLTIYQMGVNYMCIKVFHNLPPYIKDISNSVRKFEICVKWFLNVHSFYSIEEYIQYKSITSWKVSLNVFNMTIYLIYSPINLCLLSLSLKKKTWTFVLLMYNGICIIAKCIHFGTIFLLSVTDLFLCNYSHIFLCFSHYTVVCPVCNKHHPCIWLWNQFDWFQTII